MLTSTEKLLENGFQDHVFKEWNVSSVFDGTSASRYALMNKALKKGEILRLMRGVYMLSKKYRSRVISQYSIACQMVFGSFVSFETALSFHGWIPEKVNLVMCNICEGRSKSFSTQLGEFKYIKVPVNEYQFLTGVLRKVQAGDSYLIASPLRALMDYIYYRKIEWTNIDFLLEGMRIEKENLKRISAQDFEDIASVYSSKRTLSFLHHLRTSLGK